MTQWSLTEPKLKRLWVGHLAPTPGHMLFSLLLLKRTVAVQLGITQQSCSLRVSWASALLVSPSSVGGPTWNKVTDSRSLTCLLDTSLICISQFSSLSNSWIHSLLSTARSSRPRLLGQLQSPAGFLLPSLSLLPSPQRSFTSYCLRWEHFHDLSGRLKSGPPKETCVLILGTIVCYLAAIAVQLLSHV